MEETEEKKPNWMNIYTSASGAITLNESHKAEDLFNNLYMCSGWIHHCELDSGTHSPIQIDCQTNLKKKEMKKKSFFCSFP